LVGFPLAVPVPSKQESYLQGFTHRGTILTPLGGKFSRNSRENHATLDSAFPLTLHGQVQKAKRPTVLDYLQPRLFAPLGIENPTWRTSPEGITLGGYGLSVRTEASYVAKICFHETPHHLTLRMRFSGDGLFLDAEYNVAFGPTKLPQLIGRARVVAADPCSYGHGPLRCRKPGDKGDEGFDPGCE
jgi:hypothetical protein